MSPLKPSDSSLTRRTFLAKSVAVSAFTIVPRHVLGGPGQVAPSEKLNIAGVGVGGKGFSDLESVQAYANIVALCDVDSRKASKAFVRWPQAKQYQDYRMMLDKQPEVDGVIVATPDHAHAVISMAAIKRGKHVYTQKPLTHTVHEARALAAAAREYNVATQMGNHGQAEEEPRRLRELIWDGVCS
ncbi:Gfo/Idh/MocA family protein [Planctomycetota bacterium]